MYVVALARPLLLTLLYFGTHMQKASMVGACVPRAHEFEKDSMLGVCVPWVHEFLSPQETYLLHWQYQSRASLPTLQGEVFRGRDHLMWCPAFSPLYPRWPMLDYHVRYTAAVILSDLSVAL